RTRSAMRPLARCAIGEVARQAIAFGREPLRAWMRRLRRSAHLVKAQELGFAEPDSLVLSALADAHAKPRVREPGAAPLGARCERLALLLGARATGAADRGRARARRPRAPRAAVARRSAPGRHGPVRGEPSAPHARDRSGGRGVGALGNLSAG